MEKEKIVKKREKHSAKADVMHSFISLRRRVVVDGILVGIIAGLVSIAYRLTLGYIGHISETVYAAARQNMWLIPLIFSGLAALGLAVGILVKLVPLSSGSGIPQVQGEVLGVVNMKPWRLIGAKFLGGSLANLGGLSLGREGPSIQLGAAAGKLVSQILKRDNNEERYLISAGASAGLAAAFNAPISGTLFTLEEMHKNFAPLLLIPSLLASVTADYVSKNVFGLAPVFSFTVKETLPLKLYGWLIVLGIFCGMVGVVFNFMLLKGQDIYAKLPLKKEYWPIIAFVAAAVFGLIFPYVLGGGHELMENLAEHPATIGFLLLILGLKIFFTSVSYGSGAQGGIFLPVLVIGGVTGAIFLESGAYFNWIPAEFYINFIIFAMAGVLTGVIRSPILSVLLVTEMTGSFLHISSLSVVVITAYLTAELLKSKPIYESLLERLLHGLHAEDKDRPHLARALSEFYIRVGSTIDGKAIKDINGPEHSLIVGLYRGGEEIVPQGDTVIRGGDRIIVLCNDDQLYDIKHYYNNV
ncbi:ClC family H(+)/Cl(-) exchange transporter [Clostridiales bacterium COT073_COT-073]|nr:ClC family H(+)/Cl(-) exchange transporter [Clostridiales bacterium COT073_COT-073]